MTEINQRAIVHTLPLMRQPIDTGFRRESKGGRHGKKERRERSAEKNGDTTRKQIKRECFLAPKAPK